MYFAGRWHRTGSIVVNSKIFGDIARRLPDSEVFIQVKRILL